MSRPILAATDFSAAAYIALERAAQLAHSRSCGMTIVHVYNEFAWANVQRVLAETPLQPPAETAERELRRVADALGSRYKVKDITTELRIGRAATEIISLATIVRPPLIVLGAQGEGLAKTLGVGGTALKVVHAASLPVLVAANEPVRPYAHAMTATDFSECSRRALHAACEFFPQATQAAIHVYSAHSENWMRLAGAKDDAIERFRARERQEAQEKVERLLTRLMDEGINNITGRVLHGHAVSMLIEDAKLHDAGVIAVGKHSGTAITEWILGSVAHGLLHHAPCDVLVVP